MWYIYANRKTGKPQSVRTQGLGDALTQAAHHMGAGGGAKAQPVAVINDDGEVIYAG